MAELVLPSGHVALVDAARAYDAAAIDLFGAYARPNFPLS